MKKLLMTGLMTSCLLLFAATGQCQYTHYFNFDEVKYLHNTYEQKAFKLETEMMGSSLGSIISGNETPQQIKLRSDLAEVYLVLGHYDDALSLCREILGIVAKYLPPNSAEALKARETAADVQRRLGRYSEAGKSYTELLALQNSSQPEDKVTQLRLKNKLLAIQIDTSRKGVDAYVLPAERQYAECLALFGNEQDQTIVAQENLLAALECAGKYDVAIMQGEKIKQQLLVKAGQGNLAVLPVLQRLAGMYYQAGHHENALQIQEKVVQSYQAILGEEYPQTLGAVKDLAKIYWSKGMNTEARLLLNTVIGKVEWLRTNAVTMVDSRQSFFAQWVEVYKLLLDIDLQEGRGKDAFYLSELAKGRTLLDAAALQYAETAGNLSEQDWRQIRQYQQKMNMLDGEIAKNFENPAKKLELEKQKLSWQSKLTDFHSWLKTNNAKYASMNSTPVIVGAVEGQASLAEDTAFLSYILLDNKLIIFLLTSDGGLQQSVVEVQASFAGTVDAYRSYWAGKNKIWQTADRAFVAQTLKPDAEAKRVENEKDMETYLGDVLLQPFEAQLAKKRHWIISPDGALGMLPFETLFFQGKRAINNYDISYIQSLSLRSVLIKRAEEYRKLSARKQLLAMGAAFYQQDGANESRGQDDSEEEEQREQDLMTYSIQRGGEMPSAAAAFDFAKIKWINLPATEKEVDALGNLFNNADIYKKEAATEQNLQALNVSGQLSNYRYIVFSTHGYLNSQNPALSAIVLGQVNNLAGFDGYVTTAKLANFNLHSDLVVLSACETGLGKYVQGEGIMGLPYALYMAGNTNTVLTLWKVVDESTAKFNSSFMRKIRDGQDPVKALNDTKREFLTDSLYNQPKFWAPFVYYGI